jgi:hypothetical protein
LLRGGDGDSGADRSRRDLLGIDRNCRTVHRLRTGEGLLRNSRHCAPYIPVGIVDVGDIGRLVDDGGVVDVGDGGVVHRCVADVDAVHVFAADVIRRDVNFARAEREPADIDAEAASASASATDEDH